MINNRIIIVFLITGIFFGASIPATSITDDPHHPTNTIAPYTPHELLIQLKPGYHYQEQRESENKNQDQLSTISQLNKQYQVLSMHPIYPFDSTQRGKTTDMDQIYKITFPKNIEVETVIDAYQGLPEVNYAEPNYVYSITETIPNDPRFPEQWSLHQLNDCDIDAPEAWDIETGDHQIIIAIHDTGVDYTHPDLQNHIWTNDDETPDNGIDDDGNGFIDDVRGWDFVTTDPSNVSSGEDPGPADNDPMDFHGHGTHCAGIAAGISNNAQGIAGVSACQIMSLRTGYKTSDGGGRLDTDDIVAGIIYAAENGADVLSMSWGSKSYSHLIYNALNYAYSHGVILVTSAGNDDSDDIQYPAAYPTTISVGATDQNDEKASFSSYGEWVDISAPGVDILSTVPLGKGMESTLSVNGLSYEVNHMLFTALDDVTGELMDAIYGRVEDVQGLDFTGKIALIERGFNSFKEKIINVYNQGAIGAIVFNNVPGNFNGDLQEQQNIPAVSLSQADGQYLKNQLLSETLTGHLIVSASDYEEMSGTSMACPMVSGVIGLLLSKHPSLTQEQVKQIIRSTADPLQTPYALGAGRINAHQALLYDPANLVKAPLFTPFALLGLMMMVSFIGWIEVKRRR